MAQLKDTIIQGTLEIQGKDSEGKALILPEESKIYIGNKPFTGGASSEEIQQMGFITNDKIGGEELGLVKDGGNVTINADGTMTAPECAVVAEYGTTTYEELLNAFKSNKQLILHVPARKTSEKQPEMYASLVRLDGVGDNRNFVFVCLENNVEHHFVMEKSSGKWIYYDITLADNNVLNSKISGLTNNINSIAQYISGKDPLLSALSSMNAVDILKSVYNFRGGFCDNAGTLHIKNPGIYLIIAGGTGNKTITINYPTGKEYEATKWNGIILLAYESGLVTPIGIKSSFTVADVFQLPGTFQGWTSDGRYSTTISYPSMCVISYLGNSNVDYLA